MRYDCAMPKARAMARVALVTGANCGIGAATAIELAARGASVLLTYLRASAPADDNASPAYREARAADASRLVEAIRASGGRAEALEADLIDTATPARLFDCAEAQLGPVEVLVCNASGWVQDSFGTAERDRFGRPLRAVSVDTFEAQFAVDARATALLIAEFARPPHRSRGRLGAHRLAHLGWPRRLSERGVLWRRQGGAGELHDVSGVRARGLRDHGQCRLPTRHRHRLADAGHPGDGERPEPVGPSRRAGRRGAGDRDAVLRRRAVGDRQRGAYALDNRTFLRC